MANRYWVGGTDNWNTTAGTKWALTSGGTGGEANPTTNDDVFFDANSGANTVTISLANTSFAKSIDCTGFTGTITGAGTIGVAGSITLVAGMTYTVTGTVTISGTGTLTTAGKSFSALTVNGSGITVTLGDALNTGARSVSVVQGTFDTANYNVTCDQFSSNVANTRTITLGSSIVTASTNFSLQNTTGLTLNANTSSIITTGTATFTGGGQTFYDVTFQSVTTVSGANTYNSLTVTGVSSNGRRAVTFDANQTVNNAFTISAGTNAACRRYIQSDTAGTARTITCASFSGTDADFRDITIAGAAAPVSGTRLGDCKGNSGITFPSPKTVYWNPAGAQTWGTSSWATSSGSTTLSLNNFPLAQDTAVIDQNSRAGISQNTTGAYALGTFDASARTSAFAINFGTHALDLMGDYLNGTGLSYTSSTATNTFSGRTTQTITSNGVAMANNFAVDSPGGTVQLFDAFTTSRTLSVQRGTFDAKTYNVTMDNLLSSYSSTRSIKMGSGTWTIAGTSTAWNLATTTSLTFDKGTANIVLSNTSTTARTFAGGGLTYNKLTIGGATGTSTLTISGSNTFSELASTKTVAHTITFTAGTTQTVGAWTITGTAGNVVTLQSSSTTSYTLTKTGGGVVSADYMSISRSTATPSNTWYAGANSTDGGNNSGWIFTVPPAASTGNFLFMFR